MSLKIKCEIKNRNIYLMRLTSIIYINVNFYYNLTLICLKIDHYKFIFENSHIDYTKIKTVKINEIFILIIIIL